MKSIIIYYSYTGNTKKIAEKLLDILKQKGEAEIRRLTPTDESDNFFVQAMRAFTGKRATLSDEGFDLSGCDLICLGSPVWAFAPTPAVNTFLDKCQNLDGKDAICFTTYHSGAGVQRCVNAMINSLKKKGAFKISGFNIQQMKIEDANFVEETIQQILRDIGIS